MQRVQQKLKPKLEASQKPGRLRSSRGYVAICWMGLNFGQGLVFHGHLPKKPNFIVLMGCSGGSAVDDQQLPIAKSRPITFSSKMQRLVIFGGLLSKTAQVLGEKHACRTPTMSWMRKLIRHQKNTQGSIFCRHAILKRTSLR